MKLKPYSPLTKVTDVEKGDILLYPLNLVPEDMIPRLVIHTHNDTNYIAVYVFETMHNMISVSAIDHQFKGTKETGMLMYNYDSQLDKTLFITQGEEMEYSLTNRFAYRKKAQRIFRNFILDDMLNSL